MELCYLKNLDLGVLDFGTTIVDNLPIQYNVLARYITCPLSCHHQVDWTLCTTETTHRLVLLATQWFLSEVRMGV